MNKFIPIKRPTKFTRPKTKDFFDWKSNTMICSSVKFSRNKIAKKNKAAKKIK